MFAEGWNIETKYNIIFVQNDPDTDLKKFFMQNIIDVISISISQ